MSMVGKKKNHAYAPLLSTLQKKKVGKNPQDNVKLGITVFKKNNTRKERTKKKLITICRRIVSRLG